MSSKFLIWGAVAVVGLLAAGVAAAGPGVGRCRGERAVMFGGFGGGFGFGPRPGARLHEMIEDLGLSDSQKETVKSILRDSHGRIEPKLEEARQAKRALFDAALAATPDEEAVRAASESVARVVSDLTLEMARTMAAIRGTLTPEQRQQLDETLAKQRERHEKRAQLFHEFRRERFEEFLESF